MMMTFLREIARYIIGGVIIALARSCDVACGKRNFLASVHVHLYHRIHNKRIVILLLLL